MTQVAVNRIRLQPGNDARIEQAVRAFFEARRALLGGDLRSMQLVRSTDGNEYALISVWASPEADARHENDAPEQQLGRELGPIAEGAPVEFTGVVIAEL